MRPNVAVPPHLSGRQPVFDTAALSSVEAPAHRTSGDIRGRPVLLYVAALFCWLNVARPQEWMPGLGSAPVAKVFGSVGLLLVLSRRDVGARLRVWRTPQGTAFFAFLVAAVLSVPTSYWPGGSVTELMQYVIPTVPFLVVVSAAASDAAELTWIVRSVVFGTITLGIAVVLFGSGGGEGRLSVSTTYDANDLALVAVATMPLAGWMLRDRRWLWRGVGAIGIGVVLLIVVKSASRGGVIGLAAVLLAGLTLYRRALPMWGKVALIVGVAAVPLVAPATFLKRTATLTQIDSDYNMTSETGRLELWKRGLGYYASRPITGVGFGEYGAAEGVWASTHRTAGETGFKWSVAHNTLLQVAVELGTIGLVAFFYMFFPTVRSAAQAARLVRAGRAPPDLAALGHALTLSIVGFVVAGFFLAAAYGVVAVTLLALGMAYTSSVRQLAPPPVAEARRPVRAGGRG